MTNTMEESVVLNPTSESSSHIKIGDYIFLMSEEEQEDGYLAGAGYVYDLRNSPELQPE